MYIIVFRNSHKDPFVNTDDRGFIERYSSYEQAKEEADKLLEEPNRYHDYQIYQDAKSNMMNRER